MYVRRVNGKELTLRVSGKLWMRSLVMSDLETETEWAHLLGRGMAGPLKGSKLRPIAADMVTWGVWKKAHPQTTVMDMPARRSEYTSKFYRDPQRFVYGIMVQGKPWHIPYRDLKNTEIHSAILEQQPLLFAFDKEGAAPRVFSCVVEGETLVFESAGALRVKDRTSGSLWDVRTGQAVSGPRSGSYLEQWVGIMSFKTAWQNFHPESQQISYPPKR